MNKDRLRELLDHPDMTTKAMIGLLEFVVTYEDEATSEAYRECMRGRCPRLIELLELDVGESQDET